MAASGLSPAIQLATAVVETSPTRWKRSSTTSLRTGPDSTVRATVLRTTSLACACSSSPKARTSAPGASRAAEARTTAFLVDGLRSATFIVEHIGRERSDPESSIAVARRMFILVGYGPAVNADDGNVFMTQRPSWIGSSSARDLIECRDHA